MAMDGAHLFQEFQEEEVIKERLEMLYGCIYHNSHDGNHDN